jgi:hypothetical protein
MTGFLVIVVVIISYTILFKILSRKVRIKISEPVKNKKKQNVKVETKKREIKYPLFIPFYEWKGFKNGLDHEKRNNFADYVWQIKRAFKMLEDGKQTAGKI